MGLAVVRRLRGWGALAVPAIGAGLPLLYYALLSHHDAAWSYPTPYPQVARLAGYIAFDQDAVSVTIGSGRYTGVRP